MSNFMSLKINNSKEKAIRNGQWNPPSAQFYDQLLDSSYSKGPIPIDVKRREEARRRGDYLQWYDYLEEAYLIAPIDKIHNTPHKRTNYSQSGCKYPHHVIKNGELVVSIPGLKAAYKRACQMNILQGKVKDHLERHIKELGITASFKSGKLSWNENGVVDEIIEDNFHHIYYDIMERTGFNLFDESDYFKVLKSDLTDNFEPKGTLSLSDFHMMKMTNEYRKKYKNDGKLIQWIRGYSNVEALIWLDDEDNYVCALSYDIEPQDDGHMWIMGMDIAYKYNGYGLSHQLLDYAISHGVDALSVQKDNLIALKTYTSHGFKISDDSKFKVDHELSSQYDMFIDKNNITAINESAMSNEAIILNSKTLNEIGHTPEEIYEWMHNNISYDNTISGWKLRTPSEVYTDRKGNCHDQSLFEAFIFHSLNIINGQLFFIEFKQDDPVGGNAHTLTWYRTAAKEANLSADWKAEFKEENRAQGPFQYWWFENAWEDQAGIHGPYKSIDDIKDAVFEAWKKDDDINQGKYDGILFGKFSSSRCGMSLGEYVESWTLEDNKLFINNPIDETFYRVTYNGIGIYEAMKKLCSFRRWKELLTSEIFTWLPKPKEYSNANLSYFTKEGIDKFNKLVLPEAEKILGSNIKFETFSSNEIGNIVYRDKYQIITSSNKMNLIKESLEWIENFANDDVSWKHEYQQLPIIESVEILNNISTPLELLKFMDQIQYGWYSQEDQKIHGTGEEDNEEYFYKNYHLQSPAVTIKRKVGVCWDQTELERKWFSKHHIIHSIIYIEIENRKECPSHTFLLYESEITGKIHWFEHSWGQYRGVHNYSTISDAIKDIIYKHQECNNDFESPIICTHLKNTPEYGCTCEEFMEFAKNQPSIDLFDISNELFEEITNFEFQEYQMKKYNLQSLPNVMYFSSPTEIKSKTIGSKSPRGLFLSPYIGISSIFIIDRHKIMKEYFEDILSQNNREVYRSNYNIEYDEWNLPDQQLTHPLSKVHMHHNIPNFKEIRTGTASGFIYAIDVSSVKGELEVFSTNDANREVIYKGTARLPIKKVIEHTIEYEISYKNNGQTGVVETKSIKPTSINESTNYQCDKCDTELKDIQLLDVPKKDWEKARDEFPSWDCRHGELKMFICPECGNRNYIITEGVNQMNDYDLDQYLIEEGSVDEPPSMDGNGENSQTQEQPEEKKELQKKESMPKQTDRAESDKNGVRRKKLYIAFIEWCKEFNQKNTFGSIFDKDVFNISYPFVPNEMRYFYRLANPILCVLSGNLTFFQVSELRKINVKNSKINEQLIFAATENDMRIFNKKDKKIYRGMEENGMLTLKEVLAESFDLYIQNMIKKGDILNGPIEETS